MRAPIVMGRLSRSNLALSFAVIALAAFVYVRPAREEPALELLSKQPPAHAAAIRIERHGVPAIAIEKKGAVWRLVAPVSAEADAFQIERLLAILTARSTQRYPASRLERFELDRPRAQLVIDGTVYAFGMVNPVSDEQYVLTGGAVHVIHPRYGSALPVDAMQLARRQLLGAAELPVRFEMEGFRVEQTDGQWRLVPATGALGQEELARWVENWRHSAAQRVAPLEARVALAEIAIGLKSGARLSLGIAQRTPELVIVREDERLQYHFPAASAQRLLAPPMAASDEQGKKK